MHKKTLVLGASLNPERYANKAIHKLVKQQIKVVAFGLREGVVAGVPIRNKKYRYKNLHTITMYLGAKNQKDYYNYILALQPKRVIFNPGTENPEFYKKLKTNHINFEEACTLVLLTTNQY